MPLSESILNNTLWNKFSLKFNNLRLEAHYQKHSFPQTLLQSRLALLLGAMMNEMYGILDFHLIPKELMAKITLIRISATMMGRCVPAGVLPDASTFATVFALRCGSRSLYFSSNRRGFLPE